MAKQKITANGDLDILTMGEVRTLIREWHVDVAKGLRPITFEATGTTDAAGRFSLGGATTLAGGQLGPAPSIWWAVDRIAVRVDGLPLATGFSVYHGQESSLNVVRDVPAVSDGFVSFPNRGLLLPGGNSMVIVGAGAGVTLPVTVSGAAIEIPQALLWRWLT